MGVQGTHLQQHRRVHRPGVEHQPGEQDHRYRRGTLILSGGSDVYQNDQIATRQK
jgi:hypothetical protein